MPDHYDAAGLRRAVEALCDRIVTALDPTLPLVVVGIRTRGEVLAARLRKVLVARGFANLQSGVLDITLYRDDLSEIGPRPVVRPTRIDVDLDGESVLLVDDVLFTGRTVRAALDAIADFGRPKMIRLAVLVDRGGRELPIQADFVSLQWADLPRDRVVKVKLIEQDRIDAIDIETRKS